MLNAGGAILGFLASQGRRVSPIITKFGTEKGATHPYYQKFSILRP